MSNIYKDMKSNITNYYEDYNIKKNTKQLQNILNIYAMLLLFTKLEDMI